MNKLIAESKDDNKLRGVAYVAVGKLARKIPNTIASDISVVHSFFSALETVSWKKSDNILKIFVFKGLYKNPPEKLKNATTVFPPKKYKITTPKQKFMV